MATDDAKELLPAHAAPGVQVELAEEVLDDQVRVANDAPHFLHHVLLQPNVMAFCPQLDYVSLSVCAPMFWTKTPLWLDLNSVEIFLQKLKGLTQKVAQRKSRDWCVYSSHEPYFPRAHPTASISSIQCPWRFAVPERYVQAL